MKLYKCKCGNITYYKTKCSDCSANEREIDRKRSKREDFGFYGKPIIDTLFDDNGNLLKDAVH